MFLYVIGIPLFPAQGKGFYCIGMRVTALSLRARSFLYYPFRFFLDPQGHLMTQSSLMKRWTKRFFVLENGFLSHYEKKSLVGTKKRKVLLV